MPSIVLAIIVQDERQISKMGPGGCKGESASIEGPNAAAGRNGKGQRAQYINRCESVGGSTPQKAISKGC